MKNLQELVHKLDRHILPFLSLLYLLSYLDRVNISAVHDVFLEELGLTDPQVLFHSFIHLFILY